MLAIVRCVVDVGGVIGLLNSLLLLPFWGVALTPLPLAAALPTTSLCHARIDTLTFSHARPYHHVRSTRFRPAGSDASCHSFQFSSMSSHSVWMSSANLFNKAPTPASTTWISSVFPAQPLNTSQLHNSPSSFENGGLVLEVSEDRLSQ